MKNYTTVIPKMMNKKTTIIIALISSMQLSGQKPTLFIGATAHIGNGKVIENAAVSVKEDKFEIESKLFIEIYKNRLIQYN